MKNRFAYLLAVVLLVSLGSDISAQHSDSNKTNLFDGTFTGWEGDTEKTWRIEDGTIVAGSMDKAALAPLFVASKPGVKF